MRMTYGNLFHQKMTGLQVGLKEWVSCKLGYAYAIEYGWNKISIVRPANVYGPRDNFDPEMQWLYHL